MRLCQLPEEAVTTEGVGGSAFHARGRQKAKPVCEGEAVEGQACLGFDEKPREEEPVQKTNVDVDLDIVVIKAIVVTKAIIIIIIVIIII